MKQILTLTNLLKFSTVFFAALLLAGCSVAPELEPAAMDAPTEEAAQQETETLDEMEGFVEAERSRQWTASDDDKVVIVDNVIINGTSQDFVPLEPVWIVEYVMNESGPFGQKSNTVRKYFDSIAEAKVAIKGLRTEKWQLTATSGTYWDSDVRLLVAYEVSQ